MVQGITVTELLTVQKAINDKFKEYPQEHATDIEDRRERDGIIFRRVNLALEELVEANLELLYRKPHRVTHNDETILNDEKDTDFYAFKKEMIDAIMYSFSILGMVNTTPEEFEEIWKEKSKTVMNLDS